MRLRNIPGSRDIIAESPWVIQNPQEFRSSWNRIFQNGHPIHIEVGMGKGRFLMDLAAAHPECNYIGIEMYSSVLLRAVQKADALADMPGGAPGNFRFLRLDARELPSVFGPGEVGRIYLNFSDPWPKDRHAKRRLTSREFLGRYEQILAPDGHVEFKTDNRDLFQFSLDEIREKGWILEVCTWDLHGDSRLSCGNIMTEYEEKFSSQGNPICKLTARPDSAPISA